MHFTDKGRSYFILRKLLIRIFNAWQVNYDLLSFKNMQKNMIIR